MEGLMNRAHNVDSNDPLGAHLFHSEQANFQTLTPSDLRLDVDFWNLVEASFSEGSRDARETTLRLMEHPDIGCLVARFSKKTRGLVTFARLHDPNILFVGYLAVHEDFRRNGLGEKLLARALGHAQAAFSKAGQDFAGAVFEVERVEDAIDPFERLERRARLRFFSRLGALLISDSFLMPPHEGLAPSPMNLFFLPWGSCGAPTDKQSESIVQAITIQHYQGHKSVHPSISSANTERSV